MDFALRMSRVHLKFNHLPAIRREMPQQLQQATIEAGEELVQVLQRALDDGTQGVRSDARALALSLYVKATGRNDYDQALRAARDAFAGNPSRHGPTRGSEEARQGFDRIVADMEPLKNSDAHVQTAAVATMLAYGNVWEFEREWMAPTAQEWAKARLGDIVAQRLLKIYK